MNLDVNAGGGDGQIGPDLKALLPCLPLSDSTLSVSLSYQHMNIQILNHSNL